MLQFDIVLDVLQLRADQHGLNTRSRRCWRVCSRLRLIVQLQRWADDNND